MYCHITPILIQLHWLPVADRIKFKILLITFKALYNLAPSYISDMIDQKKLSIILICVYFYYCRQILPVMLVLQAVEKVCPEERCWSKLRTICPSMKGWAAILLHICRSSGHPPWQLVFLRGSLGEEIERLSEPQLDCYDQRIVISKW